MHHSFAGKYLLVFTRFNHRKKRQKKGKFLREKFRFWIPNGKVVVAAKSLVPVC